LEDYQLSEAAQRTHDRIVAAAAHAFARYGYAGARVDEIAAEAGVSKERVYHYVGRKEVLWEEVIRGALQEIADAEPFVADRLGSYVSAMLDFHQRQDALIPLLLAEAGRQLPGQLTAADERLEHYARRVSSLKDAQAAGGIRDDVDPRVILYAVLALVVAAHALPKLTDLILRAEEGRERLGDDAFHEGLERLVDGLLTPRDA
jgi:AcrR family transcriptional regulator